MSGPWSIQRVPAGLLNVLSLEGGQTPRELEQRVQGALELLQMYGLQQRQYFVGANAAIATNTFLSATGVLSQWAVLFGIQATLIGTATITSVSGRVTVRRENTTTTGTALAVAQKTTAALAGEQFVVPFWAPYPILLAPGSNVGAQWSFGTDANANVSVVADLGILG